MANFCNNGYSFPPPSVSSPIYPQYNATTMATTMHQHLVHFTPPSVRNNTALQASQSEPSCSGAHWQPWTPAASNVSTTPTRWQYTIPTTMPWISPTSSANHKASPHMYKFNGIPSPPHPQQPHLASHRRPESRPQPTCMRRCKRKSESMEYAMDQPKEKVFINEDKMSACLEQLQIDNNNLDWHANLEEEPWFSQQRSRGQRALQEIDQRLTVVEEENESEASSSESDSEYLPRLEMSQLLQVGMKTKEILPKLIIDEINKSAMQVVLWKPPGNFVADVIKNVSSQSASDQMELDEVEVTNPSGICEMSSPLDPPFPVSSSPRSNVSTPIPDLLIEAAQLANNNNTAAADRNTQYPDVWIDYGR